MDTLGPVSVLDSGRRKRDVLVADRLTRRRSPDRPRLRSSLSEMDVVYRVPQPYRTSFSAKHSVERLPTSASSAMDRSRSLSPTSSLRSIQSSRSERVTGVRRHGRAKSPKRVTYDTRVTVRHSDANDSMFAELSSRGEFDSSASSTQSYHHQYRSPAAPSSALRTSNRANSKDSGLDYSMQLKDLSDQIIKMDWSKKEGEEGGPPVVHSPTGILKESQNSHKSGPVSGGMSPSPTSASSQQPLSSSSRPPLAGGGDKENTPNGSPPPSQQPADGDFYNTPRISTGSTISRDYQYDRTFSYRQAITDHYSGEVRALVDAGIEEKAPNLSPDGGQENGRLQAQQRSSSVTAMSRDSSESTPSSQLTPAKRSVSTSISNFFKRISPHLGRKHRNRSNNSSRAGSSQSLPATAGAAVTNPLGAPSPSPSSPTSQNIPASASASSNAGNTGHFSRSKIRNSFLKLMGGPRKDSKSKVTAAVSGGSSPSQTSELNSSAGSQASDVSSDRNVNSGGDGKVGNMPESAARKLKSMEKNSFGKKDVYREFKDKCSPQGGSAAADANLEERYRAIKAQYAEPRPLDHDYSFDAYDNASSTPVYPSSRAGIRSESIKSEPAGSLLGQTQRSAQPAQPEETRQEAEEEDGEGEGDGGRAGKAEPPSSLDVVPPRAIRLLQSSMISTVSGDESIGDCSLDCNLTASQPSLLSGTSQSAVSSLSKKAVLNQPLIASVDSQLPPTESLPPSSSTSPHSPSSGAHTPTDSAPRSRRTKDALILGQELIEPGDSAGDKENASPHLLPSPLLSPQSLSGAADPNRKPSYLKLSCAVSGYGKYSRYASYKNIPTRSPFSSTSSLRSDLSSPDPSAMPLTLRSPEPEGGRAVRSAGCSPSGSGPNSMSLRICQSPHTMPSAVNGHAPPQAPGIYPTGDPIKDGEYFLSFAASEEERLTQQAKRVEGLMRSQDLPEEVNGRIRAAIGKSNLLIDQKFQQFRELCSQHMNPEPGERVPLYEDLQGFWEMVKIQVDSVDDNFAEITTMSQNGWKEVPRLVPSRRSSASSSPKSGSLSQTSTPSATPGHTPGSRRRGLKAKDTPDSSPEHAQKIRSAAKARDEARKRMLAEKRAAMKQQQQQQQEATAPDIEIFLPESTGKQ